jgi:hypothetical protein
MDERTGRASLPIRVAAPFGAVFFFLGFWIHRSRQFADFKVLRLGGELIGNGQYATAYDADAFSAIARSRPELAASHRELDVFLSTPVFGWAMRPFSALAFEPALVLWTLLGFVALVISVRILDLPLWVAPLAAVMPFGISNLHHGQTGFFAILLASAVHVLCVRDRKVLAGLVAGLVILKPTLLIGIGLWWIIDWKRWYPALLAAIPSAGLLVLPALLFDGLEPWRLFTQSSADRVELQAHVVSNGPTLQEFAKRTFGGDIGASTSTQLTILLAGALGLWLLCHRWPGRTDILSGGAIFVSILVSPHLYVYDSGLILIPLAVLASSRARASAIETMVAIYTVSSLAMIMSIPPFGLLNDWVSPGAVGMVALVFLWVRELDRCEDPIVSDPLLRASPLSA